MQRRLPLCLYAFTTVRVTVAVRVEVAVSAQTRFSGLGTKSNLDMSSRAPRCSKKRERNSIPSRTWVTRFVLGDFSQSGTQHRTIVHKSKCPCRALDAHTCSQLGVSSGSRQRRQVRLTQKEELHLGLNNHEPEGRKHESWMTLIQEERANTTSASLFMDRWFW